MRASWKTVLSRYIGCPPVVASVCSWQGCYGSHSLLLLQQLWTRRRRRTSTRRASSINEQWLPHASSPLLPCSPCLSPPAGRVCTGPATVAQVAMVSWLLPDSWLGTQEACPQWPCLKLFMASLPETASSRHPALAPSRCPGCGLPSGRWVSCFLTQTDL